MWTNVLMQGLGFLGKRREAKRRAAWDRYNNAMAGIQAAQSQNTVTDNVALRRDQHARNKLLIQTSRLQAAAKVKAGAAAAGVAGGAVEATIFDIGRNAAKKLDGEVDRMETSLRISDAQRRSIAMQRKMAIKPVTQTPSFLSGMADIGISILGDNAELPQSSGTLLEGPSADPELSNWERLKNTLMI